MALSESGFASIFAFFFRAKILIPFLLVFGVIGTSIYFQKKVEESKNERYRTITVDRGAVVQRITANSTLNPVTVVSVGTQVSGAVTKLYTDFNNVVKANQVPLELELKLDSALTKANLAQFDASLRSAEATTGLAESTLKRNRELVAKGFISSQTLKQNSKELDVENATVAQANRSSTTKKPT